MSYADKLRDPRWQKKRLEIMARDGWCCRRCASGTKTLNVHHRHYLRGAAPWEYPNDALETVCEDCHAAEHGKSPVPSGDGFLGAPPPGIGPLSPRAEILLLERMACSPDIAEQMSGRGVIDHFTNPMLAACARRVVAAWERGEEISRAIEEMPPAIAAALSGALITSSDVEPEDQLRLAEDCVRRIEAQAARFDYEAEVRENRVAFTAGDEERLRATLRRLMEHSRRAER